MAAAFIHGFILAFGLILPLGVQNAFVFSHGASRTAWSDAWPVVIVASIGDTLLIFSAVLGVSAAVDAIAGLKQYLLFFGSLFLLIMGWRMWQGGVAMDAGAEVSRGTRQNMIFAVMVSLLNPHAILDTIGVIGTSSVIYDGPAKVSFTAACIIVSWLWFAMLSYTGFKVGRLNDGVRFIRWINRLSCCVMWLTAFYLGYLFFTG